jgi:hypothetical protein
VKTYKMRNHLRSEGDGFASVEVLDEVILDVILQQLLLNLNEQVCKLELQRIYVC